MSERATWLGKQMGVAKLSAPLCLWYDIQNPVRSVIMNFTLASWKSKSKEKYTTLIQSMSQQTQNAELIAYGTLTSLTLWPLVEHVSTAAQSGQPLPLGAIMVLGSVAGGVGGNLLASQIQNWYEATRGDHAPTEADVLAWLQTNALTNQEFLADIDQMLQTLEAIPNAQAVLPESDWHTFGARLWDDLARLGNLPRYEATLIGSGVIVQGDNNTAVGPGGVLIQGNLSGDLVMGNQTKQIIDPEKMDPDALRRAYLSRLLDERNQLLLAGIDPKAATEAGDQLELSAVYTALLTKSSEEKQLELEKMARATAAGERQARRLSALEQLNTHRQLVLLGDPGSGKSTFVNFVTACLAGELLQHPRLGLTLLTTPLPPTEEESRQQNEEPDPVPQPWEHGALLPVPIVLRDLAARNLPHAGQKATAAHLWRFLQAELKAAALSEYAPLLKKELLEQGGIFLFDGLDEVPTADDHRLHIKQLVNDVATTYPRCRVLVTSRTYAYQKQNWRLPDFADTILAPFSQGQIKWFVDRWYTHISGARHLNAQDAQGQAALLKQAIFSNKRLYALAEKPLLLTLMSSLHAWRGGSLPEKREQLYADSVDLLLDAWETRRIVRDADGKVVIIQPSLEQWLQADRDKVRGLLNRLAYEAHSKQTDLVGTADIAEDDLVLGLLNLSEEKTLQPKQLMEFLSNRAGLLLPRGVKVYTFPHRTFQEYLAACHLTGSSYPGEVAELARQDPNRWREVALLAGAKAAAGSAYALWGLVQELCHEAPGAGEAEAYWGAHLAGQFLVETADLTQLTTAQAGHLTRLRAWLVQVLTAPVLPAIERALAGRHLAQLGDPRPEATDVDSMQFCLVPSGPFWLGEGDEARQVDFLDAAYWLGRYPVTHAQFMTFVQEDGYAQKAWWAEAIAAGVWKDGAYTGFGAPRTRPANYGLRFRLANLPVVGVSWYEALAFTRWLTIRWQESGWLPTNWQVTLPSEAEWEKAARGGLSIPERPFIQPIQHTFTQPPQLTTQPNLHPRRAYTWLKTDLTPEMANYRTSEINQTNSVGAYQKSASVVGCEEMLGNVYEWTRSLQKDYPYNPKDGRENLQRGEYDWTVMRGYGWSAEGDSVRCGARYRNYPNYGYNSDSGFRVVLSPFFDNSGL
ncbi:MAG: SUMF1/EgtB/PvdO family nonheme iron enzyme [Rhodobacteraceae bacterium]|nr:SUMF1/EgtB/PvdO family nonheme iron enzyme [Paracoccaceae bacterium]